MKKYFPGTYLNNPNPEIPVLVHLWFDLKTNCAVIGQYCYNPVSLFGEWGIRTVNGDWISASHIDFWKEVNQREVTI
jgi:hypothetical protein